MSDFKKSVLYKHAHAAALELGTQLKKHIERPPTVEPNPLGDAILEATALEGAIAGLVAAFRAPGTVLMEKAFRIAVDGEVARALKSANASIDEALNSGDGSYKP